MSSFPLNGDRTNRLLTLQLSLDLAQIVANGGKAWLGRPLTCVALGKQLRRAIEMHIGKCHHIHGVPDLERYHRVAFPPPSLRLALHLPQDADQHRPQRPVLLAVDQED